MTTAAPMTAVRESALRAFRGPSCRLATGTASRKRSTYQRGALERSQYHYRGAGSGNVTCRGCGGETCVDRTVKTARCDTRFRRCLRCGDRWETAEREVAMSRLSAGTAISDSPGTVPAASTQTSSLTLSEISPDLQSNQAGARKSDFGAEVFSFPVVGKEGPTWAIRETQDAELRAAFPDLNVAGEYAKARAWLNSSPTNRKTPRGMMRFLFGWMSRTQNRGGGSGPVKSNGAVPYAVREERERSARTIDARARLAFGGK